MDGTSSIMTADFANIIISKLKIPIHSNFKFMKKNIYQIKTSYVITKNTTKIN